MNPLNLASTFLRLRPDSSIEPIPVDGFWPRLMGGELGDFRHEYLVTSAQFAADWKGWEMHPHGEEIVCVLCGAARLLLEAPDGARSEVELTTAGSYVLVPRGTWHTARIAAPTSMLFITAGEGTQHRAAD
ncbi:MAG: cupin domain-containing protein [Steroidobacteraceae bacterium]